MERNGGKRKRTSGRERKNEKKGKKMNAANTPPLHQPCTITGDCPGAEGLITPPYAHINVDIILIAGMLVTIVLTGPGIQGAGITGVQGAGVGTPNAAAVAAATAGLLCVVHMPKGGMFIKGTISFILPPGVVDKTVLITFKTEGAAPKLHIHITAVPRCIIATNPPSTYPNASPYIQQVKGS